MQIIPGNEELHSLTLNVHIFSFVAAAKVGKTSLIMSLVSEEFPDEVCMSGGNLFSSQKHYCQRDHDEGLPSRSLDSLAVRLLTYTF